MSTYRVVILGRKADASEAETLKRLAAVLEGSTESLQQMVSGTRAVAIHGSDIATATRMHKLIEEAGCLCVIETEELPTSPTTYRVVIAGLKPGQDRGEAVQRLAATFNQPVERISALVAGSRAVVKRGADMAVAAKMHAAIDATGFACVVEPEVSDMALDIGPSGDAKAGAATSTGQSGAWANLGLRFRQTRYIIGTVVAVFVMVAIGLRVLIPSETSTEGVWVPNSPLVADQRAIPIKVNVGTLSSVQDEYTRGALRRMPAINTILSKIKTTKNLIDGSVDIDVTISSPCKDYVFLTRAFDRNGQFLAAAATPTCWEMFKEEQEGPKSLTFKMSIRDLRDTDFVQFGLLPTVNVNPFRQGPLMIPWSPPISEIERSLEVEN